MVKTETLKKNYEFARLYKKGKFYAGRYLVIYVLTNNYGINRVGITASKKVGKSVKRNRLRRLIKENYRRLEPCLKQGQDIVIVARKSEELPDYYAIGKEMKYLFKKLDVLDKEAQNCSKD